METLETPAGVLTPGEDEVTFPALQALNKTHPAWDTCVDRSTPDITLTRSLGVKGSQVQILSARLKDAGQNHSTP